MSEVFDLFGWEIGKVLYFTGVPVGVASGEGVAPFFCPLLGHTLVNLGWKSGEERGREGGGDIPYHKYIPRISYAKVLREI